MFLGKHDIYHSVMLYYMKIRTLAPKEVQKYIEQNEAFSRSGDQVSQSTIIGSQEVETILSLLQIEILFFTWHQ